ncbi:PD-(D/E)XK nuclease family protein [Novosphingobium resinovorum]|uniref:Double-strand break repair protein AddB n=1 Tax=Novosphingobium resinovorum TaxID=158500 RepID=A0A1D8A0T0_9SPHN|nr:MULTISPECIES: PD-(D/E)XK nuclease family protein [Novosphingobium]AOR75716.1 double-strand break repair protein AddB [Novosphingobium resinovorum]MBF7011064.1 PD-(D/E)XK nuclease family protein [Novosphingobium sp. HR1a]WJM29054.1 PD-(D/E)XK nuclease family protein [Novosphingobium resinovorum]
MPDRTGPKVYSIAAHRGFADALVAGLIPRYAKDEIALARLTLLLPSRRTIRTMTEAFVRHSGSGMLLPRMVAVGDLDLDEALGPLLDPLGAADIPPAADPTRRWLRLAHHLREVEGDAAGTGAALLRRAFEIGRTMDRLLAEEIAPIDLMSERVIGIVGDLAGHWSDNTRSFLMVQQHWIAELAARGEIDAPDRRNRLFDHAAARWREEPPPYPVIAAGVTGASPALARLLRVVSEMPQGLVVLPDLDLSLADEVWEELGVAGAPAEVGEPPFARGDAVTHPQYHLKLLLNRMGIARGEVQPWHRSGLAAAPPERSRAISNLFLPPRASAAWVDLPPEQRRLSGVRLMECTHPGEQAQAIAVLIREALETPERRVALVSPDRGLAARVVSHLERWGIEADDTAGRPLPQTAAGRLLLLLAEVVAEQAAPVPLIALLVHPLTGAGPGRPRWLENARKLDLELRGPRPGAGLAPLAARAEGAKLGEWWAGIEAILTPLFALGETEPLDRLLGLIAAAAEALCGEALWGGADGRALSAFVEELRGAAGAAGTLLDPREINAVLRDAMDRVSVRPPWGGHPRVSVYGLLEARMSRADLVICGGLVEGVWPGTAAQDALLPPAVLRALGVPGADFRIGLSAHDLAAALGAPEVVLSWAQRDEGGPVIPSRFVLRVRAMLGDQLERHIEGEAVRLARLLDDAAPVAAHPRPQPMPSAEQRKVDVSVTGLDRLRGDPYQFYASAILGLRSLDGLDAEPSAAWKGEVAHLIMERWHKAGEPAGGLHAIAQGVLTEQNAHPLMRVLWWPRLSAALETFETMILDAKATGREVVAVEKWGDMRHRDVRIHGRADRIDLREDGSLAVVDYKTGQPPTGSRVQEGFALQLGLIALIARDGGFEGVEGVADSFEYWSMAKGKDGTMGYMFEPVLEGRKKSGIPREDFLPETLRYLNDALDRWILGEEAFTARLNPELGSYADYDQLMRLDEWITSLGNRPEGAA